jgi:hypothetical protein
MNPIGSQRVGETAPDKAGRPRNQQHP